MPRFPLHLPTPHSAQPLPFNRLKLCSKGDSPQCWVQRLLQLWEVHPSWGAQLAWSAALRGGDQEVLGGQSGYAHEVNACANVCVCVCVWGGRMGRERQHSLKEDKIKKREREGATSSDWEEHRSTFVVFLWPQLKPYRAHLPLPLKGQEVVLRAWLDSSSSGTTGLSPRREAGHAREEGVFVAQPERLVSTARLGAGPWLRPPPLSPSELPWAGARGGVGASSSPDASYAGGPTKLVLGRLESGQGPSQRLQELLFCPKRTRCPGWGWSSAGQASVISQPAGLWALATGQ